MASMSGGVGSIVIAGAVARRPGRAGHAWAFLQYALGFRRLGWDVLWLDSIDRSSAGAGSPQVRHFADLARRTGLEEDASLLVGATGRRAAADAAFGLDRRKVLDRVREADLFLNFMGYVRDEEILERARRRVFLDIDPGFGQMWEDLGQARLFHGHDAYATVGERVGAWDCAIPPLGIDWIASPPPVLLAPRGGAGEAFTSVCSWRGPFAPIEHGGVRYGLRAHELRRFLDLPLRTGAPFRLALDIDPADAADRERLLAAGWELEDPVANAGDLDSYRDFIARSAGEIMIAKGLYVATRNGWFSDRSVCYLASGRPVLAQDTGWSERYPSGEGLIAFRDLDEAVEAVAEARRDPARHRRAARALAEAYFDSDLVLTRLAERAAAPRARPVEAAGGGWRP